MSPSTEPRRRRDEGFSLVEVVVSIGIVAVLVVATLPALLGGMRAGDVARRVTQAKSIALAEMERMRNLPFWVAYNAGDFIDVLDRYYTDQTPPSAPPACGSAGALTAPAVSAKGYVSATAPRCSWEPSGPLYRSVRRGSPATGDDGFVVVVDLQFLTDTTPPAAVTPPADWTTQASTRDRPPARQIGATVTVFPTGRAVRTPVQSRTQVSSREQATTRIRGGVDVAALQVGTSVAVDGVQVPLTASAGVMNLGSSLTYASTTEAVLSSVSASLGTGEVAKGATRAVSAPPTVTAPAVELAAGGLVDDTCSLVCWGGNRASEAAVSAAAGLPNAGSPTAPLTTSLRQPSNNGNAFAVGAGVAPYYRPVLQLTGPLVTARADSVGIGTSTSCAVQAAGTDIRVAATGWLRTTAATDTVAPTVVDACGTARTAALAVLPTAFAPHGVVRVQLQRASARCLLSGPAHTPTVSVDYQATVWRWVPDGNEAHDPVADYQQVAVITPATADDVLAAVPLDTTPVAGHGMLGDWIAAWSNLVPGGVHRVSETSRAEAVIPGVVSVLSRPLRQRGSSSGGLVSGTGGSVVEPDSTMSLTIGSVSCRAEDAR